MYSFLLLWRALKANPKLSMYSRQIQGATVEAETEIPGEWPLLSV